MNVIATEEDDTDFSEWEEGSADTPLGKCSYTMSVRNWSRAQKTNCLTMEAIPAPGFNVRDGGQMQVNSIQGDISQRNILFLLGIDCLTVTAQVCSQNIASWQNLYNKEYKDKKEVPLSVDGKLGPKTAAALNLYKDKKTADLSYNEEMSRNIDVGKFTFRNAVYSTPELFNKVITLFAIFAGSVAILVVLYGGMRMVFSFGGEDTKKNTEIIIGGLIGVAVVIGAYVIVATIRGAITLFT